MTENVETMENFKLGVFAATAGIGLLYLASFIMSFSFLPPIFLHLAPSTPLFYDSIQ
jgi:uncharacterized YccA/Bax inhibitor family protein